MYLWRDEPGPRETPQFRPKRRTEDSEGIQRTLWCLYSHDQINPFSGPKVMGVPTARPSFHKGINLQVMGLGLGPVALLMNRSNNTRMNGEV